MIAASFGIAAFLTLLIAVGPGYALAAFIVAVVVLVGLLGWFIDGDHVTVEHDE